MIRRSCCVAMALAFLFIGAKVDAAESGSSAELNEKIGPSVVHLDVIKGDSKGVGSGFVITEDGTLVTNYHVIAGATAATAVFKGGEKVDVQGTLFMDPKRDIAILKINKQSLVPLPLAEKLPSQDDAVATFDGSAGSPGDGTVKAVRDGKELDEDNPPAGKWIQTTAPISVASSGGPLVNRDGQVVGMNSVVLLLGQNVNFGISSVDIADAFKKSATRKLFALSDGAAKGKPNKHPAKSKDEIAAKDIPPAALDAYVARGQKGFRQMVSDARRKLSEATDVLAGMKEGTTNPAKPTTSTKSGGRNNAKAQANNNIASATDSKPDNSDYKVQMFKGQKYYHFPDADMKQKYVDLQQSEVTKDEELVKQFDDPQQGLLNYLKNGGPELQIKTVGDVGYVSDLPVLLISDDDEFRTYLGNIPVAVRGIKTDKLVTGSKLDGRVMFVAGTQTLSTHIEGSKAGGFVLREVPDEVLLKHLTPPTGALASTAKTTSSASESAKSATVNNIAPAATSAKNGDFRTWSDKTGKYKLDAQLVAKVDNKVVLKRHDTGDIVTLAIDQLSQADQDFVKANPAMGQP
jgi:Trypsin-like peptidase domain/SLA1 homology domain 1, SHD1